MRWRNPWRASESGDSANNGINRGTSADIREMRLMNKLQVFSRDFGTTALLCFGLITNSSWPYAFFNMGLSLNNGGPAGMLWMTLVSAFGMFLTDCSLAEMASMSPSSAGPYQWTAELAPSSCQKLLSFVVGYYDVLGWQAALAFSAYLIAANIQGLLFLFSPSYVPHDWHITLLMIASALGAIVCNYRSTSLLRSFSWLMGVLFVSLWLYICITLAIMAPHPKTGKLANRIATQIQDPGGWGSGFAALVGILGPISTFVGGDVSCHMSEETEDASVSVPRAIYRSALVGYTLAILTTVLIIFSLGSNTSAILSSPSGQPYQQVLYNATKRENITVVLVTLMITLLFFNTLTTTTASSRQMFTFARDGGLPLSNILSQVTNSTHIPRNSVIVTFIIITLLALIPLGSVFAFGIITSLSSIAILSSYFISITCRLANRLSGHPIQQPRWNLGAAGGFVNAFALMFLGLGIVMICFPSAPNPTTMSFNWTVVIWSGVTIFAIAYYFTYGKYHYVSPRSEITQPDGEVDVDTEDSKHHRQNRVVENRNVEIMPDETA